MNGNELSSVILAVGTAAPGLVAAIISLLNFFSLKRQNIKIDEQHKASNSRLDQLMNAKVENATLVERARAKREGD